MKTHAHRDLVAAKIKFMFKDLEKKISKLRFGSIDDKRKNKLQPLIDYIQEKVNRDEAIQLHFICTHNSRRSQFGQVWAKVAAGHFNIEIDSYSGGVEVTACNERTINSLIRYGFTILKQGNNNPKYMVNWGTGNLITLFSKLVDDDSNPEENFAAIMTCSHADENCPVVFGSEKRISITYEDPGVGDGTDDEERTYDQRSEEIATDLFYVFSKIKK